MPQEPNATTTESIPLWRDERVFKIAIQVAVLVALAIAIGILSRNFVVNYSRLNLQFGFGFLDRPASFGIGDTAIPYEPTDPYSRAILIGILNSLRVMILGIILATAVGIFAGVARLSDNWLVRQIVGIYIEIFRNTPLLLQLFFWYFAVFLNLPSIESPVSVPGAFLTQRGVDLLWPVFTLRTGLAFLVLIISATLAVVVWQRRMKLMELQGTAPQTLQIFQGALVIALLLALIFGLEWELPILEGTTITGGLNLSPEFAALLAGLVLYTGAFIAEVVRAGIQSVPKGQWEAARALGLQPGRLMQLVIFPQALRVIIPPLTSEFLNLAKNSSLAIAIGYNDIYSVSNTTANQTGRSIEMILIIMAVYLTINLLISLGMNVFNQAVQLKER
jgi:general L-amino acid transport system permease protein